MPGRRVFRLKSRIEPLSKTAWMFFLATDVAGMDAACEEDGGEFFSLYYMDGWLETFAEHREEITSEWRKRGWTRKQKRFVLQLYRERGFSLKHDRLREERSRIFSDWKSAPEPKSHDWRQHLEAIGRLDLYQDLNSPQKEKTHATSK